LFKRRNPRSYWESLKEMVYPRSGWRRALYYIRHRLQRLPDTPHKIAMGFACGVFISFTPLFGLHFVAAALLAIIFRGNIVAAILGTFFGNPITFPFIAGFSYRLGWFLLGHGNETAVWQTIRHGFSEAFHGLWHNFIAIFTPATMEWAGLLDFWWTVFFPYLIGGLMPGFVIAVLGYLGTKPLIAAYQKRRRGRLLAKIKELRAKKQSKADAP
jgi:uncharacterized protein (DUF2062 family)